MRRARAGHHMHVRDLAGLLPRLENEAIVVSHLTRRTPIREAKRALAGLVVEATLGRVRFLMDGPRNRPRNPRPPADKRPANVSDGVRRE